VKLDSQGLVSIVTPAFNSEGFMATTIESVIHQTYKNWELIIIDDRSTDNTVALVQEYAQNDNRIKCFVNEVNSGAGVSRNNGLKQAKGRYIAFLDSDDLWKENKLEMQILFMLENKAPISFTSYTIEQGYTIYT